MKRIHIIAILLYIASYSTSQAQYYKLNGYVGLGYSRFITDMDISGLNNNGYSGTLKIMWQPEHLLRLGIETGYYQLYSFDRDNLETEFGDTNVQSSLHALPVFINWTMQITSNLEIFFGSGPTFLYTSFESFGVKANSTQISTSYIVGAGYSRDLADDLMLGGELKYYRINKIEDGTLTLQIVFKYRLFQW